MKNVQIPYDLFLDLYKYFLTDLREPEREENIIRGLKAKAEAIDRHNTYTQYKTAQTPEQQEQARQNYLDKVGVPSNFRW